MLIALLLGAVQAASAPPAPAPPAPAAPVPFEIVEMAGVKRGERLLVARSGSGERYIAVGCSPGRSRSLVPLARMPGVDAFWAVPGLAAGGHRVRYSFDGGPEMRARWLGRGSHVGAPQKVSKPAEFIDGLVRSSSVWFRVYEVGDRYVEDRFAYRGAAEAVAELARRCAVPADGSKAKKK